MAPVRFNPVQPGSVAAPADWRYFNLRACAERGLYPPDWIGEAAREMQAA